MPGSCFHVTGARAGDAEELELERAGTRHKSPPFGALKGLACMLPLSCCLGLSGHHI